MVARLSIRLDPFEEEFKQYVSSQLRKVLTSKAASMRSRIEQKIRAATRQLLVESPEYVSLLGGKLQAELGVPESLQRISAVIDQWISNISVTVVAGKSPLLTVEIGVIQSDYQDVLSLPAATYSYTSSRSGPVDIPWLEWLLLEGDKRIVRKYSFAPIQRGSRTGLGIMIKDRVSGWQVPAEYSGTASNNFAIRALESLDKKIDEIVDHVIKASL
tara:strand:+ start:2816 stop:3463 length:648 start_codon:yes stop_codon:yes gene_type:complete